MNYPSSAPKTAAFYTATDPYSTELCTIFLKKLLNKNDKEILPYRHDLDVSQNIEEGSKIIKNQEVLALFPSVDTRPHAQLLLSTRGASDPSVKIVVGGDSVANQFTTMTGLKIKPNWFYAALAWLAAQDQFTRKFDEIMRSNWPQDNGINNTWRMVCAYEATLTLGIAINNITSDDIKSERSEIHQAMLSSKWKPFRAGSGRTIDFDRDGNRLHAPPIIAVYDPGSDDKAPSFVLAKSLRSKAYLTNVISAKDNRRKVTKAK